MATRSDTKTDTDIPRSVAPYRVARLDVAGLREISGLAASTRDPAVLWAQADGGNEPLIYAIDHGGQLLGRWRVGAENRDWEDIASVERDGRHWLLVGDIGDNGRRRDHVAILAVPEPAIGTAEDRVLPVRRLRFRYPDGPQDAESLAVDGEDILVLSKEPWRGGAPRSRIHRLPFPRADRDGDILGARLLGTVATPARSVSRELVGLLTGIDLAQPTAFDIAGDRRSAWILDYGQLRGYRRHDAESWAERLARPPDVLRPHALTQAEALAIDDAGTLWFSAEGHRPPLWRYVPPAVAALVSP